MEEKDWSSAAVNARCSTIELQRDVDRDAYDMFAVYCFLQSGDVARGQLMKSQLGGGSTPSQDLCPSSSHVPPYSCQSDMMRSASAPARSTSCISRSDSSCEGTRTTMKSLAGIARPRVCDIPFAPFARPRSVHTAVIWSARDCMMRRRCSSDAVKGNGSGALSGRRGGGYGEGYGYGEIGESSEGDGSDEG